MTARRATLRLLLLLALAIASIGCDRPKTPDLTPSDGSVVLDRFRIVATSRQLKISALDGRVLLATPFDASRPGSPSLA